MSDVRLMQNKVHCIDCIKFLRMISDNVIDSCVTDPPYGLEFMGKEWDSFKETGSSKLFHSPDKETDKGFGAKDFGTPIKALPRFSIDMKVYQDWCYDWAKEVFRVLKPGSHILAFSGTRTYHRLACAVEDAGFEIRNMIPWIMGSGFPKGLNISFGIMQKQLYEWLEDYPKKKEKLRNLKGTERRQYMIELMVEADIAEVLDKAPLPWNERKQWTDIREGRFHRADGEHKHTSYQHIIPKTPEAKKWYGFNTQLKPAIEPIVFARKPISEKSIVENVLKYGTGAINEGACRIAVNPDVDAIGKNTTRTDRKKAKVFSEDSCGFDQASNLVAGVLPKGRYPANLILSHHPSCRLIKEGNTQTVKTIRERDSPRMGEHGIYGKEHSGWSTEYNHDSGDPEIWQCVEGCPVRILNEQSGNLKSSIRLSNYEEIEVHGIYGKGIRRAPSLYSDSGGAARFFYCAKPSVAERSTGLKGKRNIHITVKPLEIMRWLVRLITPRDGIVLDPFLGSGTTAIAAENEGCNWLACDNNEEYCQIAEARIKALGGTQTRIIDFQDKEI